MPHIHMSIGLIYHFLSGQILGERGERRSLPLLAGERRSPSLLWVDAENGLLSFDDSYLQHKQQKKMCAKCLI